MYITELTEASHFAVDTAFHTYDASLEDLVNRLKNDANLIPKVIGTLRKTCKSVSGYNRSILVNSQLMKPNNIYQFLLQKNMKVL